MVLQYKAPTEGQKSSIDSADSDQMKTYTWLRKSLIEAKRKQRFMPMSSTIGIPKHAGKQVKLYEYIPLLDDRNVNDQGIDASGATIVNGNLYGSSRDIGMLNGTLPVLGENGGRVNRVGFKRTELEGSIEEFGFFYEFTQASLDFDSDDQLGSHLARELMNGAHELTEAVLQRDLLNAAGTLVYPGAGTADDEVTPEGAVGINGLLTYDTLSRLDQTLTALRSPTHVTMITGSRMTDTRTIGSTRIMYIGPELVSTVERMRDPFGNAAFVPVHQYAAAATVLDGEIGSIGKWRFIEVQDMFHWAGAGAEVVTNPGYRTTTVAGDERYDVFPMLTIGDDSFTALGFQHSEKGMKFNIITKMPGVGVADRNDPYGKTGFSSIQWWYGFLGKRPHRIALIKVPAPI